MRFGFGEDDRLTVLVGHPEELHALACALYDAATDGIGRAVIIDLNGAAELVVMTHDTYEEAMAS